MVLKSKLASESLYSKKGAGGIDKVICKCDLKIKIGSLIKNWRRLKYDFKKTMLKDRKIYLEVSDGNKKVFFNYCKYLEGIKFFFFNPSEYRYFTEMEEFIVSLVDKRILNSDIVRLDFYVDLPKKYTDLLKEICVKFKRVNSEHVNDSLRTGIYIGTSEDKFCIYDKQKQKKLAFPMSRVERRVKGRKIFIKKLIEFRQGYRKIKEFGVFKNVILEKIYLLEKKCKNEKQRERYNELKILLKYEGIYLAKKKLNRNRNFERDYGPFIKRELLSHQLSDYFLYHVRKYFINVKNKGVKSEEKNENEGREGTKK